MEMTREELLQVGDAEVDSTTDYEDSPKKPKEATTAAEEGKSGCCIAACKGGL